MDAVVACEHDGDRPVILEATAVEWPGAGIAWDEAPRCPLCGFRTRQILDEQDNDITDSLIVSTRPSTWSAWNVEFDALGED